MNINKTMLSESSIDPDPFLQFECWYRERLSVNIHVPNNISLGTASKNGLVSVRTVLLKNYNKEGFVFFSNYNSRKGMNLESNPRAALLFYWPESARQIRIEGTVIKIPAKESDLYFNTRTEETRLSAWASAQSSIIPDRSFLENRVVFYKNIFKNKSIERPAYWGGYRLIPSWFEFWQERQYRLHDRIVYSLSNDKWKINRLAP
jgi:pyridoxamine 5'-phosphate oxidase